jgi:hypothetical protein
VEVLYVPLMRVVRGRTLVRRLTNLDTDGLELKLPCCLVSRAMIASKIAMLPAYQKFQPFKQLEPISLRITQRAQAAHPHGQSLE